MNTVSGWFAIESSFCCDATAGVMRELFIDYQLTVAGRLSAAAKRIYACCCVSRRCRRTMLATE